MGGDLTAALFSGAELRDTRAFVRRYEPDLVVGHGLGDLAALAAADVLAPADALALAALREQLIARAGAECGGGLLAIADADAEGAARRIAARSGARVARHDSPLRVVLTGSHAQLRDARRAAGTLRITVEPIDAPGALHGPAMRDAARRFATAVAAVPFADATRLVYSTVTAAPMRDPRAELAGCLAMPVLWRQTVGALCAAGTTRYVESGPGRVLGDLVLATLTGAEPAGAPPQLLHAR
jgi:[acyl-carrier-protein] S-malonyltransferase